MTTTESIISIVAQYRELNDHGFRYCWSIENGEASFVNDQSVNAVRTRFALAIVLAERIEAAHNEALDFQAAKLVERVVTIVTSAPFGLAFEDEIFRGSIDDFVETYGVPLAHAVATAGHVYEGKRFGIGTVEWTSVD